MTLTESTRDGADHQRTKTTLFCPQCDHAGPHDGDWIVDDSTSRHRLLCPRCGVAVVDRADV